MRVLRPVAFCWILVALLVPAAQAEGGWWKNDWLLEAAIGGGTSRLFPETSDARTQNGEAMRVGLAKGLTTRFMIGLEMGGVLREGGPPDSTGMHSDTFLLNNALTLRARLRLPKIPGPVIARAGAGYAMVKSEFTSDGEVQRDETDTGVGYMLAFGYAHPLGSTISLGFDLTASYLAVDGTDLDHATFLSATFVVQWHPWPRKP
jgi:hypothetical protein